MAVDPKVIVLAAAFTHGACGPPATMPHFAVPIDLSNVSTVSDRDLKGRPALIVFFAPTQPESRHALQVAQAMFLKYHSRGLAVVGFQIDEVAPYARPNRHDPKVIERRFRIGFPVGRDCCGAEGRFCVSELPAFYFVSRNGSMTHASPPNTERRNVEHSVRATLANPPPVRSSNL